MPATSRRGEGLPEFSNDQRRVLGVCSGPVTSAKRLSLHSYQQNGKNLAIRQAKDRVPSGCFCVFFGGAAVLAPSSSLCECCVNSSSLVGDGTFSARRRFELVLAPSVSNPEFDRAGTLKQLRHSGLVEASEHRDGSSIMPERLELPSLCFEIRKRDTAIVLKDGRTAVEQKPPHVGELWFVQEI